MASHFLLRTLVLKQQAGGTEQFDLFLIGKRNNRFIAFSRDHQILASDGSYRVDLGAFVEIRLDLRDRPTGARSLFNQPLDRRILRNRRENLQARP